MFYFDKNKNKNKKEIRLLFSAHGLPEKIIKKGLYLNPVGDDMGMQIAKLINIIEKGLLSLIAILAVVATIEEVFQIYLNRSVQLADLLLLFIYTEVLGMIGIFFVSNKIPITIPIFISMTAIARLIILQGKEMDMPYLLYESG